MLPAMSTHEPSYTDLSPAAGLSARRTNADAALARARAALGSVRLQLAALIALSGALNLWALQRNGWANQYYSAAVRSMGSSWHDFLFASMDRAGVMTVDKPPLALWIQALSVRVFGYHPLAILVPQALIGVASVVLVYDLVRRRFGRLGGFVAGLALALTPIAVAVSRHNNPDALLVLCSVAAIWCTVRALASGRTRWLALAGLCVGLGFETKMGVALMVVPGIAAAYLWVAPVGRARALRQLGAGGLVALLVGGAWPLLVELTPAGERPWISGTKGNRIWELITEYNGVGRLDGQTGGPAGAGGNMFGGATGPLRLLNDALGGQAGWLLGFALVSGLAILLASRLRRRDPRSGWLLAVGGSFAVVAVVFSGAKGIFHPYYVSLLAPFAAALTGAGVAQLRSGGRLARVMAPLALVAGVACELAILHEQTNELRWLAPLLIVVGAGAAVALAALGDRVIRTAAVALALAALLIGPAIWSIDTLGYATNGTFPSGGPQSALIGDGPGGGRPGFGGGPGGGPGFGGGPGGARLGSGARGAGGPGGLAARSEGAGAGGVPLFGPSGAGAGSPRSAVGAAVGPPGGGGGSAGGGGFAGRGGPPGGGGPAGGGAALGGPAQGSTGGGGAFGAPLGNGTTIARAIAYAKSHGGGTVAVDSQSSAASEIVSSNAEVAGIGGFSGRESDVSVAWLADEVGKGAIRWVLSEGDAGGVRLPGDTREGSKKAIAAAARVCRKVALNTGTSGASGGASGGRGGAETALYDCAGRAQALLGARGAA
jgi:4-amino-4-deoxy-L-arabinose transferase-like glycosyltransferase